jgi:hypothetical protein
MAWNSLLPHTSPGNHAFTGAIPVTEKGGHVGSGRSYIHTYRPSTTTGAPKMLSTGAILFGAPVLSKYCRIGAPGIRVDQGQERAKIVRDN